MEAAHEGIEQLCDNFALVMHDWSRLGFRKHKSKRDTKKLSHEGDVGYDLATSLVVSDRSGSPITAVLQNLVTKDGLWSSRASEIRSDVLPHLDELSGSMAWLKEQGFAKRLVHIVDREADSVGHWRQWHTAGHLWLLRIKGGSRLVYQNQDVSAAAVADGLSFRYARDVVIHGKPARQLVAETTVTVTRNARPKRKNAKGRRMAPVPGETLTARLVVSRIEDEQGNRLAVWYLLSNVEQDVPAERLVLWYYWRWNIESFFKLIKQAGQQLESWEQETALRVGQGRRMSAWIAVSDFA